MSEGTFQLRVFSGRGLEVEATVLSANVPSQMGALGFLANHCDYVGLLSTGMTEYVFAKDGAAQKCLTSGGICTFSDNVLTLLADSVDMPDSYDMQVLSEDVDALKLQLEKLSLFDPEWEALSQRVARIEAVKVLARR